MQSVPLTVEPNIITVEPNIIKVESLDYLIELPDKNELPTYFNPIVYKRLNYDLNNLNVKELINHYLRFGIDEKRKYKIDLPLDFNPNIYKELNVDLVNMSDEDLKTHYIKYGFIENRRYMVSKKYYFFAELNANFENDYQNYEKESNMVYIIGCMFQEDIDKYYYDLITHYSAKKFKFINNKSLFDKINFKSTDLILIKNFLNIDITVEDILNKNFNGAFSVITIHDFVWLSGNNNMFTNLVHSAYLNPNLKLSNKLIEFFNRMNIIIHPSNFTYNIYSKYFDSQNFKLISHPDIISTNLTIKIIPKIENQIINIMIPSQFNIVKGAEYINKLMRKYKSYKNHIIKFHIIGDTFFNSIECSNCVNLPEYDENEFFDMIKKYNIHGLIYLNKLGETWSYCLTKGIISGLPIYYSLNGAYLERIINIDNYFGTNEAKLEADFANYLDYIISNHSSALNTNSYDDLIMIFPKTYDMIFKTN